MCVCVCALCNLWMCVVLYFVGVSVGFVMCGCVYVWTL